MRNERLRRNVLVAVLGALSFMLMLLEVNIPPFASFLKYDPGDIPSIVAAYSFGPGAGVVVQTVKAILFWLSGKSTAGWVGVLANFLAGAALVIATAVTHRILSNHGRRSWPWQLASAAVGAVVMSVILIPLMAILVYPFWGMKGAAAWNAALYISTPFNLLKGFVSTSISLAFYRRLRPFLEGSDRLQKAA